MFRASDLSLETLLQKASRPLEQCLRLTHENEGDSIASGDLKINIVIPTRCMSFSIGFLQALFFFSMEVLYGRSHHGNTLRHCLMHSLLPFYVSPYGILK